ncbi:MAG: FAD-dependent monooxygenase, partial [Variovorax sp.]
MNDTTGPTETYDVVIVGAGPAGLTTANILGQYGVKTLLVERNAATVGEPRAVSIDDESLRTMQYIGLVDEVRKKIVEGYGSHYFSPGGQCFAKVLPDVMDYGFVRRSAFRQPVLEQQLRAGLERFSSIETRFCTRVSRITAGADDVAVTLQSLQTSSDTPSDPQASVALTPTTSEVRARYLVACDGAKSGIREALGIPMSGSTYDQRWLIVDLAGSNDRFRHTRVYC